MAKMWAGRTTGDTAEIADAFNSSIQFDSRMYRQDITGSIAHAQMLKKQGIIAAADADLIAETLPQILEDIESGKLPIDPEAEDIHMFVEQVLTQRIGDVGKKLHTARSRNDQVALDMRLYMRDQVQEVSGLVLELIRILTAKAETYKTVVMPGYTHMQHAQPVLFAHHFLAYAQMLMRDYGRLQDSVKRINVSPIGSCALAGTTYDTDRFYEAELLGMTAVCGNSLDGVSDRDFCVEFMSNASMLMMHLSRLSEEIILWASSEFRFVELSDGYTTGSSIMPQKKNPDMAELCRGKTGRVYGDLMALLTTLKGIPLAYNKDMQEDKEATYDAVDTVKLCLQIMTPMIGELRVNRERMYEAAQMGFMNATDLADYLVKKGLPFRDAYKISGKLVAECIDTGCILETLPLEIYQNFCPVFEADLYDAIDLLHCVDRRNSYGGTGTSAVEREIEEVKAFLSETAEP